MIIRKSYLSRRLLCMGIIVQAFTCFGQDEPQKSQNQDDIARRSLNNLYDPINYNRNVVNIYEGIPTFYEKEDTKGSEYLSHRFLYGIVTYANRPENKNQAAAYFNFDKMNNQLVTTDGKNVVAFPNDTVSSFVLTDSGKIYSFEKVPLIDNHLFLQPLVKNTQKYSLYKRINTKLRIADYKMIGYGSTGKRYNEYVDTYEYYILYPDNQKVKKLNALNKKLILKDLKEYEDAVNAFFDTNSGPLTEEMLANLILFINT